MKINLENSPLVRALARHELEDTGRVEGHDLNSLGRVLFLSAKTVRRMLACGELQPDGVLPNGTLAFSTATLAAGRRAVLEEIVSAVLAARPNASESELASLVAQAIGKQKARSEEDAVDTEGVGSEQEDAVRLNRKGKTRQG